MPPPQPPPGRSFSPFRDRTTRPLIVAFLGSELADGVTMILVPLTVYAMTGSTSALALTFLGRLVLASVVGWLGGWLADSVSRRSVLLWTIWVRLLLVGLLLAPLPPAAYIVTGIAVGAVAAFDNPAAEAALRQLHRHDLRALAVVRRGAQTLSFIVGPAIAGLFVGFGQDSAALVGCAIVYVGAWLLLRPMPALRPERGVGVAPGLPTVRTIGATWTLPVLIAGMLGYFLVGAVVGLAVPYLAADAEAPPGAYGYAMSAYGIGAMAGLALAGRLRWPERHLPRVMVVSLIAYGAIAAAGFSGPWWAVLVSWCLWGIAFGPESVMADAYVARTTPNRMLARMYALWAIFNAAGSAAAYLLMFLTDGIPPETVVFGATVGCVLFGTPLVVGLLRRAHP